MPRVIVRMENLVKWRSAGETEVVGENLPQRQFVHHKSHLSRPRCEPGPPRWEASDKSLEFWRGLSYLLLSLLNLTFLHSAEFGDTGCRTDSQQVLETPLFLRVFSCSKHIFMYPGFSWLIRGVLIWWCNLLNFTKLVTTAHKSLPHCHLLRLGTLGFWPYSITLSYSIVLRCTPSRLLTVPSYNSSARTPQKTPSSVVRNACYWSIT
jgi:hypothetical protein